VPCFVGNASGRGIGFGFDRVSRDAAWTASLERESDELLRRQKRYLEALLEISPTAIVALDLDRNVTSWNLAAEELFGLARVSVRATRTGGSAAGVARRESRR
jgi:PAS domain-containing protein